LRQQKFHGPSTWEELGLYPNDESHSPFDNVNDMLALDDENRNEDVNGNVVVRLRMATEVYYARVLDITIQATKEAAAAVQIAEETPPAASEDPQVNAGGQTGPGGNDKPNEKDDNEGLAADSRAARLEARLSALEQDKSRVPEGGLPGGSARIMSVSKNQVGMRRVFDRPVAIGFRGFDFKVTLNAETGKFIYLEFIGITNSMLPRGAE
jgi:hypothetical protein